MSTKILKFRPVVTRRLVWSLRCLFRGILGVVRVQLSLAKNVAILSVDQ